MSGNEACISIRWDAATAKSVAACFYILRAVSD